MRYRMVTLATFAASIALAGTSTADAILETAKTQAAQGQRKIWVNFHASW